MLHTFLFIGTAQLPDLYYLNNQLPLINQLADVDERVAHTAQGCIDTHIREAGDFFK